jgi:transcriptional regulator with XRE-family HTH domain
MNLSQKIGATIRKYRLEKGLTQEELAFRTDLQQSQIYRLENGIRRFNSEQLEKISQVLDIPVIKFFEEEIKVERDIEERKLFEKISRMRSSKRKQLIEFLLNLDDNIDLKVLEKAIEIVKLTKKK